LSGINGDLLNCFALVKVIKNGNINKIIKKFFI